ncbi:hypothetical protein NECAME_12231 [Necator americanus]|uniref:Uncharacterized protein n=1 Tax=Necator americanus TaxID=51031 RepID=W2T159_NECAM|nr:hypothetical protein NECAME_12231 [Necator americanus]ETN75638.1 hypothetical protein NECAME_12231 [Necator americanus]
MNCRFGKRNNGNMISFPVLVKKSVPGEVRAMSLLDDTTYDFRINVHTSSAVITNKCLCDKCVATSTFLCR